MTGCRHEWLSESRNAPYVRCGKCDVPKMAAYATGWEDAMRLAAADIAARDAVIKELREVCEAFDKWFCGWCPNQKCCAASGKPIHDKAVAALARSKGKVQE